MKILSNYELSNKNINFIYLCSELMKKYPFKWYYFMEIFSKDIIYIKDTTMIIELLKLKEEDIIKLFTYFKVFLKNKVVKKIIYKKEYLIILFNDKFSISFFETKNKWMLIPLMEYAINNNLEYYFDAYVKAINTFHTSFLFYYEDYIITFSNDYQAKEHKYHIPLVINLYNNNENNLLFSFDIENLLNNLKLKLHE